MIVTISVPAGTTAVKYGRMSTAPDENNQLELPDYVANTLLTIGGVALVSGAAAGTAAALLAALDADFEANYLFWAYGQLLPAEDKITAALALLAARGVPAVSLS